MSYILNALRKSEKERQTKLNPAPENSLLATPTQKKPLSFWLIIALIIINILVLIYFIFIKPKEQTIPATPKESNNQPVLEQPSNTEQKKTVLKKIMSKPVISNTEHSAKTEQSAKTQQTKLDQQTTISEMLEKQSKDRKAEIKPKIKVTNSSNKSELRKPQQSLPKKPETKPTVAAKAQIIHSEKPKAEKKIPYLHEMSPSFRRSVPDLNINVFVYSKKPADRFVIMAMKKYLAGQETADGLEIKEIASDSLILRYQNKTFQVKRP